MLQGPAFARRSGRQAHGPVIAPVAANSLTLPTLSSSKSGSLDNTVRVRFAAEFEAPFAMTECTVEVGEWVLSFSNCSRTNRPWNFPTTARWVTKLKISEITACPDEAQGKYFIHSATTPLDSFLAPLE
jgi:hypothetical protein